MHIDEAGPADAPPLLLLHGGGVSGWMWRPTIAALARPVRTIVPDLPGHGRSASADYRSHAETVDALERELERRAPGGATVVGFSLGAQLTVLLAARRPDLVTDAVVVSAQAKPIAMASLTLGMLAAAAPLARWQRFARLQAKELFVPEALVPEYLADSARITRATLVASVGENLRFTPPAGWGEGTAPALVAVGARERSLMRRSAEVLHEARPSSELRVIEGVGHGLPLQRPDLMAALLDARLGHPSG
ncbi:alpha/beta fold hydrolase [Agrococcus carbonis]|uniref:Pimeloyl-ACP methyl ester carboxylesterase n=1 Tax=Agrococcus carbonis TaxID=684552 RepID=A0A1H1L1M0_9MICO|nr:alpha/beta hydrolase [Agrococcus carbonis]SDR68488.1 Pimeloyl-ACP methyl ester carboxylesterase [Agrococcus carbonis]